MIRSKFDLTDNTGKVSNLLNAKRKEFLLKATIQWHGAIISELSGSRSGIKYRIPGTGRFYTASAPGEAPAVRLAQLRQSYRFRVIGPNYMETGEVGSPLDRAVYLEKGTKNMAPRPHVQAAFDKHRAEILATLSGRLDE